MPSHQFLTVYLLAASSCLADVMILEMFTLEVPGWVKVCGSASLAAGLGIGHCNDRRSHDQRLAIKLTVGARSNFRSSSSRNRESARSNIGWLAFTYAERHGGCAGDGSDHR